MFVDLIPYAVVAVVVLGAAGIANRADRDRQRIAGTLDPDEIEVFRRTYWWPGNRRDMPTKFHEYAAAVDRYRRITFTAAAIGFGVFFAWVYIGWASA